MNTNDRTEIEKIISRAPDLGSARLINDGQEVGLLPLSPEFLTRSAGASPEQALVAVVAEARNVAAGQVKARAEALAERLRPAIAEEAERAAITQGFMGRVFGREIVDMRDHAEARKATLEKRLDRVEHIASRAAEIGKERLAKLAPNEVFNARALELERDLQREHPVRTLTGDINHTVRQNKRLEIPYGLKKVELCWRLSRENEREHQMSGGIEL